MAVCCSRYELEAQLILDNMVTLCKEHFGASAKVWFTEETYNDATHCNYNKKRHALLRKTLVLKMTT